MHKHLIKRLEELGINTTMPKEDVTQDERFLNKTFVLTGKTRIIYA